MHPRNYVLLMIRALLSVQLLFLRPCDPNHIRENPETKGADNAEGTDTKWGKLSILFPHDGAAMTYNSFPSDVLIEVHVEDIQSFRDRSALPSAVTHVDEIGSLSLSVTFDGVDLGTISLGQGQPSAHSDGLSQENSWKQCKQCEFGPCAEAQTASHLFEDYRKIDDLRRIAFDDFQKQEFGSDESFVSAERWTALAEELASTEQKLAKIECKRTPFDKTVSSDRPYHRAANDGVKFSAAGVRRAVVWADAQFPHPYETFWMTLSLHNVLPGDHDLSLMHEHSTMGGAARVSFKLLGTIEAGKLPDGLAPLIGFTVEEAKKIPVNFQVLSDYSEWGQEWNLQPEYTWGSQPTHSEQLAQFSTVSICVLTGFPAGARESLSNSLKTWVETGLLGAVNETIIFFQTILPSDFQVIPALLDTLAKENVQDPVRARIIGSTGNIGIGRAIGRLLDVAKTDHILFLEDDWIMPFSRTIWVPVLTAALSLVKQGRADVVRLKSDEESPQLDQQVSDGLHYVLNCGNFKPPHAPHFFCACLDRQMQEIAAEGWQWQQVHEAFHDVEICWRGGLSIDGEDAILTPREGRAELLFYCMPSRICKYTNTPSLFARDWFMQRVGPIANADPGISFSKHFLEETVNITWPKRQFVVAVPSSGLFAHLELTDKASS